LLRRHFRSESFIEDEHSSHGTFFFWSEKSSSVFIHVVNILPISLLSPISLFATFYHRLFNTYNNSGEDNDSGEKETRNW